jgi:hypothetical protein
MSQEKDFKKLQQKTYQSYHQDGLIDIIIGLAIIGFGLNMAFDNSAFLLMGWLPIIFYAPLKNYFTVPRIGYVKFHASNKVVTGLVIMGLLVFLLGLFVFFIGGPNIVSEEMQAWLREYYMLIFGGVASLCFLAAGLLTGIIRLYVYAFLFLIVFALGTWLDIHPAIFTISIGLIVEGVGLGLLIRFLRKYPLPEQENAHE